MTTDEANTARLEMTERAKNRRDIISVPTVLWRRGIAEVRKKWGLNSK